MSHIYKYNKRIWHIFGAFFYINKRQCVARVWWLWWVGALKLYVSFAKEPYKTDNILQKRPKISQHIIPCLQCEYARNVTQILRILRNFHAIFTRLSHNTRVCPGLKSSHGTHGGVMSHMNKSWHVWMVHVMYECARKSTHISNDTRMCTELKTKEMRIFVKRPIFM